MFLGGHMDRPLRPQNLLRHRFTFVSRYQFGLESYWQWTRRAAYRSFRSRLFTFPMGLGHYQEQANADISDKARIPITRAAA